VTAAVGAWFALHPSAPLQPASTAIPMMLTASVIFVPWARYISLKDKEYLRAEPRPDGRRFPELNVDLSGC